MSHSIQILLLVSFLAVLVRPLIGVRENYSCPSCGSRNGRHARDCPWDRAPRR